MIKNIENKMEKMQESMNKDLEESKNKHTRDKQHNYWNKKIPEGINSRIAEVEERISELEDKMDEITSEEQNKIKRMKRAEDSLRHLWHHIKYTNLQIIWVPEEDEKKKRYEKIFGDYSWKVPEHGKGNSQSGPRGTKRINPRRNTPRYILTQLTKTKHKERMLKAARGKQQVTYKGNPMCLTADLSAETLQARRQWQDIFKVLKGKNLHPRLLYPARISF